MVLKVDYNKKILKNFEIFLKLFCSSFVPKRVHLLLVGRIFQAGFRLRIAGQKPVRAHGVLFSSLDNGLK